MTSRLSMDNHVPVILVTVLVLSATITSGKVRITKPLKSTVALLNTTGRFSCAGIAKSKVIINNNYEIQFDDLPENKSSNEIRVTGYNETINGSTIHTYDIEITALMKYNGSFVRCEFDTAGNDYITGPEYLNISASVEELGNTEGFKTPQSSSNSTHMVIDWMPPWSYLVNSYTVTVINISNNMWTDYEVNVNERRYVMEMGEDDVSMNTGSCHEFDFYITAFTDIGSTKSGIVRSGHSNRDINVSIGLIEVLTTRSKNLKAEVSLEVSEHCAFTVVQYNVTIYSNNSEIQTQGPTSTKRIDFEGLEADKTYTLQVVYWTNDGHPKYTSAQFNISSDTDEAHSPSSLPSCIPTRPVPSSQVGTAEPSNSNWTAAIAVLCIVVVVLIAIVFVVSIVYILALKRITTKTKRDTNTNDDSSCGINIDTFDKKLPPIPRGRSTTVFSRPNMTTIKPSKKERRPSVQPRVMATNPLYEGSSALYSYLPDAGNLRVLDSSSSSSGQGTGGNNQTGNNDLYLEIPPPVPLPRKENLDSPGVKAGVQLSLDKQVFLGLVESPADNSNDQYVQMQSNGDKQRYVRSPSLKDKIKITDDHDDNENKD